MLAAAQIRADVAGLLTGLPLTGARVFPGRSAPLGPDELPAWVVTIESDETDAAGMHYPAEEDHTLVLLAEFKARDPDDLEALFDAAELQARNALGGNSATPPPHQLRVLSTRRIPQREGEAAAGTLRLRLETFYVVAQDDPETLLSN